MQTGRASATTAPFATVTASSKAMEAVAESLHWLVHGHHSNETAGAVFTFPSQAGSTT
jgi:hypothetical protein